MSAAIFITLSRFLFYQHFEVFLQHIHTSLQSQLLADKRCFEQGGFRIERMYVVGEHFVYKVLNVHHLHLCLLMETSVYLGTSTELQCRLSEELLDTVFIQHRIG